VQTPVATTVAAMTVDSPALAAGVEPGDEILAIDGEWVRGPEAREKVMEITKDKLGETVQITVDRGGEELVYPVALNSDMPALNTSLAVKGEYIAISPAQAVALGAKWPFQQTARQLQGLWDLITGGGEAKVGGPVAIAKAIKGSAEQGFVDLIVFSALISTVLGMFNLLPLPALDGGRLIFLFYEAITRRPPNKVLEERIHMVGMLALLGLIAWATVNDLRPEKTSVWQEHAAEFEAEAVKLEAEGDAPSPSGEQPGNQPEPPAEPSAP
jgi:regulator of sigma E protease